MSLISFISYVIRGKLEKFLFLEEKLKEVYMFF